LRSQRALLGARERPVEVTPVGQIAAVGDEAEHVDHRDEYHGTGHAARMEFLHHPADDLGTDDFIAMDRRADKDRGSAPLPVKHPDDHIGLHARRQVADRNGNVADFAGSNHLPGDFEQIMLVSIAHFIPPEPPCFYGAGVLQFASQITRNRLSPCGCVRILPAVPILSRALPLPFRWSGPRPMP